MKENVIAIVPAAGSSKRFGSSVNKIFTDIKGMPLLIYTLKRLHEMAFITEIIPVLKQEDMDKGLELIETGGLNKIKQIAPGGRERQDSVRNALRLIKKDCIVLIHDGARPLVSAELVTRLLQDLKGADGVVPGTPLTETLKEINKSMNLVVSTVSRDKFRSIQTPQAFLLKQIKKAYDMAYSDGFYSTDDAALVERTGGKVKIIMGDPHNIKVTTKEDIDLIEYFLNKPNRK